MKGYGVSSPISNWEGAVTCQLGVSSVVILGLSSGDEI